MNVTPVNGHILIELPPKDTSVYIPDSLSDSIQQGTILKRATDIKPELLEQLTEGSMARWEKFAEADGSFKMGDKLVVLIKAQQIMGVVA